MLRELYVGRLFGKLKYKRFSGGENQDERFFLGWFAKKNSRRRDRSPLPGESVTRHRLLNPVMRDQRDLSRQVNNLFEKFLRRGDDSRVGLESLLVLNELHELLGDINVRQLDRVRKNQAEARRRRLSKDRLA